MLKLLKRRLLSAAKGTGLFELVAASQWRRRRLLILCYHSIAVDQEHLWRRQLFLTPTEFAERLELLKHNRVNVLSLVDALARLRSGTLPARSVVLTFDDGTADFYNVVWPQLRQYGYPATVYASTYYSEKRQPVFPLMCSYLLWKGRSRVLQPLRELGITNVVDLSNSRNRAALEQRVVGRADQDALGADEKNARAGRLADALGIDYADLLRRRVLQLMTPDEMRQVAAEGADLQLHTHRHRMPADRALFEREIVDNRSRLEAVTLRHADHFCYPSGLHAPHFLPWLDGLGVESAATCLGGLATATTGLLRLPRVVDTVGLAPIELEGWISGVSQALPTRAGTRQKPPIDTLAAVIPHLPV